MLHLKMMLLETWGLWKKKPKALRCAAGNLRVSRSLLFKGFDHQPLHYTLENERLEPQSHGGGWFRYTPPGPKHHFQVSSRSFFWGGIFRISIRWFLGEREPAVKNCPRWNSKNSVISGKWRHTVYINIYLCGNDTWIPMMYISIIQNI